MQQGNLPIEEALRLYGDLSLREFAEEAIKYGLIPLNMLFYPRDELKERPQTSGYVLPSCQNYLAS